MGKNILLVLGFIPFLAASAELDCDNASNTVEINHCAARELEQAENEMQRYLEKSINTFDTDSVVVESIEKAQKAWSEYTESHCNSVYSVWRDGTIRGVMAIGCKTKLTRQRSHELWLQYLTYMGSSEPLLPEPKVEQVE